MSEERPAPDTGEMMDTNTPLTFRWHINDHDISWSPDIGRHYILQGRDVVPCNHPTWAEWFEHADRRVAWTEVASGVEISTVFLGLDHNFCGNGPPLIFETMVFWAEGPLDGHTERWSTYQEAVAGHAMIVAMVEEALLRSPQTEGTAPLPGSICEACFDAPATSLAPAPYGGEMGVCGKCVDKQ